MERLTYRVEDQHGNKLDRAVYQADTGKGVYPISSREQRALNKLADYEDAEEAGRLIVLPVALGDAIFRVCAWENSITKD